ncbi:MAG TPA: ATP-binding cassette domain-containing protein [Candidatus Nanoarchaeia archaeon]|nr:ATP-binding cassette domain-containing protein [Candidatus Nanoarchaeia archaeon]
MIEIKNLSKTFKIESNKKDQTLFSHVKSILERKTKSRKLEVLKNISFNVQEGEFLGIIGVNGSGKSTLLRILGEIMQPDKGEIKIKGKIVPFLSLNMGFFESLSAKENVLLNGVLMGIDKHFLLKNMDNILEYTGLKGFRNVPLKKFSKGMNMRLVFGVARYAQGDIYLVDEMLRVGDKNFREKCHEFFEGVRKKGKTIVYTTHNFNDIEKYCDRVVVLHKGKIVYDGDPKKAINFYEKITEKRS